MAEHLSQRDLDDFLTRLQQAALRGYKNPERKGCPGAHSLREVAGAAAPFAHPAYEHIKTCSPCLQEMLDMQGIVIKHRARRNQSVLVGCLAFGILLVLCAMFLAFRDRRGSDQQLAGTTVPEVVELDFSSLASQRGANQVNTYLAQHLARKVLALEITLPFGSDNGTYSVEIRDAKTDAVSKTTTGVATILDGSTQLRVSRIDLSNVSPGEYLFVFRHAHDSWNKAKIIIP